LQKLDFEDNQIDPNGPDNARQIKELKARLSNFFINKLKK